jgi:hypothetical protein
MMAVTAYLDFDWSSYNWAAELDYFGLTPALLEKIIQVELNAKPGKAELIVRLNGRHLVTAVLNKITDHPGHPRWWPQVHLRNEEGEGISGNVDPESAISLVLGRIGLEIEGGASCA